MENRVYLNDDWKFSEQFTEEMLGDGFDVTVYNRGLDDSLVLS